MITQHTIWNHLSSFKASMIFRNFTGCMFCSNVHILSCLECFYIACVFEYVFFYQISCMTVSTAFKLVWKFKLWYKWLVVMLPQASIVVFSMKATFILLGSFMFCLFVCFFYVYYECQVCSQLMEMSYLSVWSEKH